MATLQDDIGRAIAAVGALWTDVFDATRCGYGADWDVAGHANEKGRARVIPGPVTLVDDDESIAGSARYSFQFLMECRVMRQGDNHAQWTQLLRYARIAFNPESRAVQAALAALTSPSPTGKLLGATVVCSMGEPVMPDTESGTDAVTIQLPITAIACENLT